MFSTLKFLPSKYFNLCNHVIRLASHWNYKHSKLIKNQYILRISYNAIINSSARVYEYIKFCLFVYVAKVKPYNKRTTHPNELKIETYGAKAMGII